MKKQTELDKYWADREDLKEVAQKEAKSVLKFAKGVAEELLIVHKDDMVSAIKEAVEVQINGNLREIKAHLTRQDEKIDNLAKKIKPFSITKEYLWISGKIILYAGMLATAIYAIMRLLKL